MATYTKYTKKDGSINWKFQTYLGIDPLTGKQKRTTRGGFKTKKEATLAHSRLKLHVEKNGFTSSSTSIAYTFQDVYDLWIVHYEQTVKESTFHKTTTIFKNHILPEFAHMKINLITINHCQNAVKKWSGKLKNFKLINNYTGLIFKYAISLSIVDKDPTRNIIMPIKKNMGNTKDKVKFLEKEELNLLLSSLNQEAKRSGSMKWYAFFRFLAFSGVRRGEALALEWTDIDFVNQNVTIDKTLTRGKKNKLIIQTPKTTKSKRVISLDSETLSVLQNWKRQQHEIYKKFGFDTNKNTQLVFSNSKNKLTNPTKVGQYLDKIISKYKLVRITPHGLRHTHCSLLFEAGLPLQEVQDRLGHEDVQTTMNVYTHVSKKKKEKNAQTFADYMKNS